MLTSLSPNLQAGNRGDAGSWRETICDYKMNVI